MRELIRLLVETAASIASLVLFFYAIYKVCNGGTNVHDQIMWTFLGIVAALEGVAYRVKNGAKP